MSTTTQAVKWYPDAETRQELTEAQEEYFRVLRIIAHESTREDCRRPGPDRDPASRLGVATVCV